MKAQKADHKVHGSIQETSVEFSILGLELQVFRRRAGR